MHGIIIECFGIDCIKLDAHIMIHDIGLYGNSTSADGCFCQIAIKASFIAVTYKAKETLAVGNGSGRHIIFIGAISKKTKIKTKLHT